MTILAVNWGNALLITGVGFGLVFSVLVLLIFIVKGLGAFFTQKPKAQAPVAAPVAKAEETTDETISEEPEEFVDLSALVSKTNAL